MTAFSFKVAGPDYRRISLESSLAVHRFPWENIRGRISYCMNDNFHSKVLKTVKNFHLKELTARDSSESIFKCEINHMTLNEKLD